MKSAKIKISLIANFIAIFCLLILGIITFVFVKDSLFKEVIKAEQDKLISAKNLTQNFYNNSSSALERFAQSILHHPYEILANEETLIEDVGIQLKAAKDIGDYQAIYLAKPDGELVLSNKDSDAKGVNYLIYGKEQNYDATTREFYIAARKKTGWNVTDIYTDIATGLPTFTYSISLTKNGKFIGVLAIDVSVKKLEDRLKHLPGSSFVFDKALFAFASTDENYFGKDNKNVAIVAKAFSKAKPGEAFFYTNEMGKEKLSICDKIDSDTICSVTDIDSIEESSKKMAYIQITAVIAASFISIILLYFIISYYLSPLQAIQKGINSFF
ncbi:PDC sensor domain-containing protein, partial [Campylobacter sp. CNRCH_2014_2849]